MGRNIKITGRLVRMGMIGSLFVIIPIRSMAQTAERQVIGSGGNIISAADLEISCTIGEPMITTAGTPGVILTQGFQQPYFVAIVNDNLFPWLELYPNPANGDAVARFILDQPNRVTITVTNAIGQQVMRESVNYARGEVQYILRSSGLLPGIYFVSFWLGNGKPMVTKKLIRLDR